MTAEWERALHNIEIGEQDANAFQHEMEDLATSITKELLAAAIISEQLPKLTCPKCRKQQLLIRDLIVKCPDESCNWAQFRRICGVQLGIDEIKRLIVEGRTTLIKGMQSKSGKRFDAYIVRGDEGKTHFEFNKNSFR